jgi:hypothetical protein
MANRMPSDTQQHREVVKIKIMHIYDDSKQKYDASKITKSKLGIKAQ